MTMMTKVIKELLLLLSLLLLLEQLTKGMKHKLLIAQIPKTNVKNVNHLFDHHHNTQSMVSS
jgi:hypothetical protein